jgi:hypothetical protein
MITHVASHRNNNYKEYGIDWQEHERNIIMFSVSFFHFFIFSNNNRRQNIFILFYFFHFLYHINNFLLLFK